MMRTTSAALMTLLAFGACATEEVEQPASFRIEISSPSRGSLRSTLGAQEVTGRLVSLDGTEIVGATMDINGTPVTVNFDGTFSGQVPLSLGTNLIHTNARDAAGHKTADTRAVLAGASAAVDSPLEDSMNVAISDDAFAKIASAAGTLISTIDMAEMLSPMNPVVNVGAEAGEDCLFAKANVLDVNFASPRISMVPVDGGMAFEVELFNLDVPLHAWYAAACVDGATDIRVTASRVFVSGVMDMHIMNGKIQADLNQPDVQIDGFQLDASGVPGSVLNLIDMNSAMAKIISWGLEKFMGPMVSDALTSFEGVDQTLSLMGHQLHIGMAPTTIDMTSAGAIIRMDSQISIIGSEKTQGYVFTPNGAPTVTAADGFQLAVADDVANQLLAGFWEVGGLNMSVPHKAGPFDTLTVSAKLPPRVTGTAGNLKIVVGDMMATLSTAGVPQATLALNLELDLVVDGTGNVIKLKVAENPTVHADVVEEETANVTGFNNDDLDALLELSISHMVETISTVIGEIPVPSIAGVTVDNLNVGGRDGFVTVTGALR